LKHIHLFTTSNKVINFGWVRINLSDSEIKKVHPNYWISAPNRTTRPMLPAAWLAAESATRTPITNYCQVEAITSCPAAAERIQEAGFLDGQPSEKRNPEFIFLHCPVF